MKFRTLLMISCPVLGFCAGRYFATDTVPLIPILVLLFIILIDQTVVNLEKWLAKVKKSV